MLRLISFTTNFSGYCMIYQSVSCRAVCTLHAVYVSCVAFCAVLHTTRGTFSALISQLLPKNHPTNEAFTTTLNQKEREFSTMTARHLEKTVRRRTSCLALLELPPQTYLTVTILPQRRSFLVTGFQPFLSYGGFTNACPAYLGPARLATHEALHIRRHL